MLLGSLWGRAWGVMWCLPLALTGLTGESLCAAQRADVQT
jgi:hypothetical protein